MRWVRDFPVEVTKEGSFPPMFYRGQSNQVDAFARMYRYQSGTFGVDTREDGYDSGIVYLGPRDALTKAIHCIHRENCNGFIQLNNDLFNNEQTHCPTVICRRNCGCLKGLPDSNEKPLALLFRKKYETPYLAACGLAKGFCDILCMLPHQICHDEGDTGIDGEEMWQLHYRSYDKAGEVVEVWITPKEGGFYLSSRFLVDGFRMDLSCINCSYKNPGKKKGSFSDEARFQFKLGCCEARICEVCIPLVYSTKDAENIPERAMLINTAPFRCPGCDTSRDVPTLSFSPHKGGFISFPAPYPVAFLGMKPVISKSVFECVSGIFERSIEWILPFYETVPPAFRTITERRERAVGNEMIDAADPLEADWYMMKCIVDFLMQKRKHVAFALDYGEPFPQPLLDLNEKFYVEVLEKGRFYVLLSLVRNFHPPGVSMIL